MWAPPRSNGAVGVVCPEQSPFRCWSDALPLASLGNVALGALAHGRQEVLVPQEDALDETGMGGEAPVLHPVPVAVETSSRRSDPYGHEALPQEFMPDEVVPMRRGICASRAHLLWRLAGERQGQHALHFVRALLCQVQLIRCRALGALEKGIEETPANSTTTPNGPGEAFTRAIVAAARSRFPRMVEHQCRAAHEATTEIAASSWNGHKLCYNT